MFASQARDEGPTPSTRTTRAKIACFGSFSLRCSVKTAQESKKLPIYAIFSPSGNKKTPICRFLFSNTIKKDSRKEFFIDGGPDATRTRDLLRDREAL